MNRTPMMHTAGVWETDWYTCRADHDDVALRHAKKVGDPMWRALRGVGPFFIEHSHWGGNLLMHSHDNPAVMENDVRLVMYAAEMYHMLRSIAFNDGPVALDELRRMVKLIEGVERQELPG